MSTAKTVIVDLIELSQPPKHCPSCGTGFDFPDVASPLSQEEREKLNGLEGEVEDLHRDKERLERENDELRDVVKRLALESQDLVKRLNETRETLARVQKKKKPTTEKLSPELARILNMEIAELEEKVEVLETPEHIQRQLKKARQSIKKDPRKVPVQRIGPEFDDELKRIQESAVRESQERLKAKDLRRKKVTKKASKKKTQRRKA